MAANLADLLNNLKDLIDETSIKKESVDVLIEDIRHVCLQETYKEDDGRRRPLPT